VLAEQIRVVLGEEPAARWMGDRATIEAAITGTLRDLPGRSEALRKLL
jgi:hypothetical protein